LKVRENDGKLVKSEDITFAADGEVAENRSTCRSRTRFRVFTFQSKRKMTDRENNALDALITVRNDHRRFSISKGSLREYKYCGVP
jgi:hypothetical protein